MVRVAVVVVVVVVAEVAEVAVAEEVEVVSSRCRLDISCCCCCCCLVKEGKRWFGVISLLLTLTTNGLVVL